MYADMASELARLRVDDLLREGCRLRLARDRRAELHPGRDHGGRPSVLRRGGARLGAALHAVAGV